jgi:hypothetical protein
MDFFLCQMHRNSLTVCLYFVAKYNKIEVHREAIFEPLSATEKWLRFVIKTYHFYYEPQPLFSIIE